MDQKIDPKISAAVSREIAIRDLADIADLRRSDAFNRFFLRRVGEMRDKLQKSFEEDMMDKDQREATRQLLKQVKEIIALPDRDEATIRSQLR